MVMIPDDVILARIERTVQDDEVVEVRLTLIPDHTTVHLNDGDEFVTVRMLIDPFKLPEEN